MPEISKLVPRRASSARGRKPRSYPDLNYQTLGRSIGISATWLGRIMNGLTRPSMPVAQKLAGVLGWSIDQVAKLYKQPYKQTQKKVPSNGKSRNRNRNTSSRAK